MRFLTAVFIGRFRLFSLNVNGMRQPSKRRALFQELRTHKADIYLLQETHATLADHRIWASEWGGKVFFSDFSSNSRGVAVLLSRNFSLPVTQVHADKNGRFLIIQVEMENEVISIANIYAPTRSEAREQVTFMTECEEILAGLHIQFLYLGGDFNTQLSSPTDTTEKDSATNGSLYRTQIRSLMSDYSFTDIWHFKNPESNRGTFHRGS